MLSIVWLAEAKTAAALAIYKVSKRPTGNAVSEDGACRVAVLFWVVAGGLALLNITQGYVVKAWCVSTSKKQKMHPSARAV